MAGFTISGQVPETVLPHLEELAKARGLEDVSLLLGELTQEQIARMQACINDPVVGAVRSDQPDIAGQDEHILRQPD